jgi:hypothetical protein
MGAVRTTFAMTAACLVRRRQLMLRGLPDPYATKLLSTTHSSNSPSGVNTVSQGHVQMFSAKLWGYVQHSLADTRYVLP